MKCPECSEEQWIYQINEYQKQCFRCSYIFNKNGYWDDNYV